MKGGHPVVSFNFYLNPKDWFLVPYASRTNGVLVWQVTWWFLQIQICDVMRLKDGEVNELGEHLTEMKEREEDHG